MRTPTRRPIDRAAVAKSLRDLKLLFGKKSPPENESARRQSGAGVTGKPKRGIVR